MEKSQSLTKKECLSLNQDELLKKLNTTAVGLSSQEAERRLKELGPNILGKKTHSALLTLARQFKSSLVYMLIAASVVSYFIKDYSDGTIILAILVANTFLGFYQEYRSEKIIEKLSRFISKRVRVKRDGEINLIDWSKVVIGDALVLIEGDIVPADVRILESDALEANESELTGESVMVPKRASVGSENTAETILFNGTIVEKGRCTAIVYATGENTELGDIAKLSTETKKKTQYEKSLESFSASLMKVVLAGLALIFVVKIILDPGLTHSTDILLFMIALAVAVVPEVLPMIATVTLSSGALKLAKKHVVVKRLTSLEDLGNVNLLCTDKTGTLTENKMKIHAIDSSDAELFQKLAYAAIIPLKGRKHRAQNSYDDAFIAYVSEQIKREADHFSIVKELPFDPDDRRRRVVIEDRKDKKYYLVVTGAPESLVKISTERSVKPEYLRTISREGQSGLHHIALAYKEVSYSETFDIIKNERGLDFLGFVSLEDPLRPSAKAAIERAESLGIKIKVLTGDSKEVAEYVGRQVGLVTDGDKVYSGEELDAMSGSEYDSAVTKMNVFARVSPEQKFRIIQTLKKQHVVAYQGDGINDAPSLKLADVSIAVDSATDIAKESADIVLLNKSLEVIINGITDGRSIFVNINKYIKYTMASNFGMFIALSVLYLFSATLPILPIQILLNSLLSDLPLTTVYSDKVDDDEVVKPEKHDVKELLLISVVLGLPTGLFEIVYFLFIHSGPEALVQTSIYVFLTFQALVIFFTVRTRKHFWQTSGPSRMIGASFLAAFIISLAVIYVPQFQIWFSFVPLSGSSILLIIVLMGAYFLVADQIKVWYYRVRDQRIG